MTERSKRRAVTFLAVLVVGTALAVGFWLMTISLPAGTADPDNPRQVARGEIIYKQRCASCHGAKLEGQANWRVRKPNGRLPAPPHDRSGHTWHHPDAHLFRVTKNGLKPPLAPAGYESDMPAFAGTLTDEEIWAVLAYIKSTWPARERSLQDRLNRKLKDASR